jgi:hypothetical protein
MVRFVSPQEPQPTKTFYGIASSIAPWRTSQGLFGDALGARDVCAALPVCTCEIDRLNIGGSKSPFSHLGTTMS